MNRKPPPPLTSHPPRVAALAREVGEAADIALESARIAKRAADAMPS
jgi:hypothetical protein